jgi:pimeloyl-ACP methyl ester carboxylesterase
MSSNHFTRLSLATLMVAGLCQASALHAQATSGSAKPTIVLVHGAFADGSSWERVIPILQRDGYNVIAVQNPLSSLDNDVETTKRVIDAQQGPVVVVGHSYGGAVITEAAAGNPKVKALVYISAFAPDSGEPIGALGEKYPAPQLGAALRPDAAGYLYIDQARFHDVFAADMPESLTRVAAATQKPIIGSVFGAAPTHAAWKTIPSFYLLTLDDKAINPEAQRFYAQRMKATTVEIRSSHVSFLSHPEEVVRLIERAAQ